MTTRSGEVAWRDHARHTLARLLRTYGGDQFQLCEDAVQDALLEAQRLRQPPDDLQAWLVTAARRRYIDRIRADSRRREREARAALLDAPLAAATAAGDDALLLLRLCCHPELPRSGQVALTLRAVAGLTTRQIAGAYQVPEATIAQRITRAKRRLSEHGRAFPAPEHAVERLAAVLDVLYLMFTEAHHTAAGEPATDADLAAEAIRLARLLREATPESTEVAGLLALMLLTEARHPARVGPLGVLPTDVVSSVAWRNEVRTSGIDVGYHTHSIHGGPHVVRYPCSCRAHRRRAGQDRVAGHQRRVEAGSGR